MVDRNIIWHFRFRHRGGTESRGHLFVEFGQKTVTQIPPFEISVTVHFIKRECLGALSPQIRLEDIYA